MNKKSLLSLCLSAGILTGVPAFTFASEAQASGNPPASATALPAVAEPAIASTTPGPAAETVAAATSDDASITATAATEINKATATAKTPEIIRPDEAGEATEAAAGDLSKKTGEKDIGSSEAADPDSANSDPGTDADSEAAVDPSAEENTDPAVTDTDSETDPDTELSSDADATPEATATATPEIYDPFAADPFTGSPLLRMKRRLENLAGINGRMQKSADLALAVAASASEDRYFRRNCEYLTRLVRRAPFPALASTLVFPEFLGIANELMLESTRAIVNIFIEDLQYDPQKRLKLLQNLAELHLLTGEIAQIQRKALQNVKDLAATMTDQARRRAVGAPPADLLKKTISEVSQLLDQSASRWNALLNQHDHHRAHFSGILDYLVSSNDSLPAVRHAARLNQMLRSLLDFKICLEDFYGHVSASPARLADRQQALSEKLAGLAERSNHFRSRVAAFDGRFPSRENDPAATPPFSCADELTEILSLLEKMHSARIMTGLAQADAGRQSEIPAATVSGSDAAALIATPTDSSEPGIPKLPTAPEKPLKSAKTQSATSDSADGQIERVADSKPEAEKTLLEELVAWVDGSLWPLPAEEDGKNDEEKDGKDKSDKTSPALDTHKN